MADLSLFTSFYDGLNAAMGNPELVMFLLGLFMIGSLFLINYNFILASILGLAPFLLLYIGGYLSPVIGGVIGIIYGVILAISIYAVTAR